jgi:hypothetical protein
MQFAVQIHFTTQFLRGYKKRNIHIYIYEEIECVGFLLQTKIE